jgi:uncharacterized protein
LASSSLVVVSDTSPILNLGLVGHLALLPSLFPLILVPTPVAAELARYGVGIEPTWMQVVDPMHAAEVQALQQYLDPGESATIVVADEHAAGLVLMDELAGRRIAAARGLKTMGVLGILAEAKRKGLLAECRPLVDRLMAEAGFWIGAPLRARYLESLGELP